ncbi:uncharacterized protein LOC118184509 [Stegodyphus dumicola]|uniref:uncharacterized protein LOC118184509 n=1 Tax=Stegodyphus dumicola TaxID=202533 RepID=UPI0015B369EB|nr:uncharacterized protein LOC118184509 [Stegodyphus dumicola]
MPLISYHSQIETQIENFVENFKKNGSVLISTLNVESYGTSLREGFTQWTPSDDSATDYPRTSAGCSSYDSSCSDSYSCEEAGNSDNASIILCNALESPLCYERFWNGAVYPYVLSLVIYRDLK